MYSKMIILTEIRNLPANPKSKVANISWPFPEAPMGAPTVPDRNETQDLAPTRAFQAFPGLPRTAQDWDPGPFDRARPGGRDPVPGAVKTQFPVVETLTRSDGRPGNRANERTEEGKRQQGIDERGGDHFFLLCLSLFPAVLVI